MLLTTAMTGFCQSCAELANAEFDFDQWNLDECVRFDSLQSSSNVWQIGSPQKSTFTAAYSESRAIVTDTIFPYPASDTSSFTIIHLANGGFGNSTSINHYASLRGYYFVNSDSLNDFGTIEVSPNNGQTWIDLINDTAYSSFYDWNGEKPVLTGNSNGWTEFEVFVARLSEAFEINFQDTILYRFTFISDSIEDNLDGVMFDNLSYADFAEGVDEIGNTNVSSNIYPNPTQNEITVELENPRSATFNFSIYDCLGELVFSSAISSNRFMLDSGFLPNGFYLYQLSSSEINQSSHGRFVVARN